MNSISITSFIFMLMLGIGGANAKSLNEMESKLYSKCLDVISSYLEESPESFLRFHDPKWIKVRTEKHFREVHLKKNKEFHKYYPNAPEDIIFKGIKEVKPHSREVSELGVETAWKVYVRIKGNKSSSTTYCKFNKTGEDWYLRFAP